MTPPASTPVTTSGRFVSGSRRRLYVVEHAPGGAPGVDAVILVPPFAEEMNRSRRMFTLLGQRLAAAGWSTFVVDLSGTGESDGEFGDATWEQWLEDLDVVAGHARERGFNRLWYCGVRLGAALALDFVGHSPRESDSRIMLWQPVLDGSVLITQFLRLRLASSLRSNVGAKETTAGLRERLAAGASLEVAGYTLNPALVARIDGARLADLAAVAARPLTWLEVLPRDVATPPSAAVIGKLRTQGLQVDYARVEGDQFWATPETTVAPALIEAASERLLAAHSTLDNNARSAAHV